MLMNSRHLNFFFHTFLSFFYFRDPSPRSVAKELSKNLQLLAIFISVCESEILIILKISELVFSLRIVASLLGDLRFSNKHKFLNPRNSSHKPLKYYFKNGNAIKLCSITLKKLLKIAQF